MTANLYETTSDSARLALTKAQQESDIFLLVDQLSKELLNDLPTSPADHLTHLAARTTDSFPALKMYLEGERKYRSGQFEAAINALTEAVKEDSTFALAYYKMYRIQGALSTQMVDRSKTLSLATKYADKLPKRDQLFLQANHYHHNGIYSKSETLLRELLQDGAGDADAWYLLGISLFRSAARKGRSVDEAQNAFNRALALGADDNSMIIGFLQATAATQSNTTEFITLTRKRLELAPNGHYAFYNRAMLAFAEHNPFSETQIIEEYRNLRYPLIFLTSIDIAKIIGNYRGGRKLASLLTDSTRAMKWQFRGHVLLAEMDISRGRFSSARKHFTIAKKLIDNVELSNGLMPNFFDIQPASSLLIVLSPFTPYTENNLVDLYREINSDSLVTNMDVVSKNYILGLLNAHLDKLDEALNNAGILERFANTSSENDSLIRMANLARDLAHSVKAKVHYQESRFVEALAELGLIELEDWWSVLPISLIDSQAYERYLRIQILKKLQRYDEAIRWASTLGRGSYGELVYLTPAEHILAEIYEETNQPEKAIEHYGKFVELWQDCDPELRWRVAEAERRITRLRGE